MVVVDPSILALSVQREWLQTKESVRQVSPTIQNHCSAITSSLTIIMYNDGEKKASYSPTARSRRTISTITEYLYSPSLTYFTHYTEGNDESTKCFKSLEKSSPKPALNE